jgi:hypothetical protein
VENVDLMFPSNHLQNQLDKVEDDHNAQRNNSSNDLQDQKYKKVLK